MRTLYLLRHANPVSSAATQNDFDRPLSEAGKLQAEQIAKVLNREQPEQFLALSSPAVRARETTEVVLGNLTATVNFNPRIYDAELRALLDLIRDVDEAIEVLIMIGHNPGMESLVRYFTHEVHPMPTAALAKIVLESDSWRLLNRGAHLEWLVTP